MLFAASEKIQTDIMSAISVPNEDVELVVKVKDHNQGSDTYKEIFSYEIPAKEPETVPVLPQTPVEPKVVAEVTKPVISVLEVKNAPSVEAKNLTLSVVDSAKAAAAVLPVEKSKVESAVIATLEKAKEQIKGNSTNTALTDMAKSIESTLSNDTMKTTKASTLSTTPSKNDVVEKTIALAKENAKHPPAASDVIQRTIALAKEKEVRKSHPLTGGLTGLLGNADL
jgi:hypothetical protein